MLALWEVLQRLRDWLGLVVVDVGSTLDLLHVLELGRLILHQRLRLGLVHGSAESLNSSLLGGLRIEKLELRGGVRGGEAVDL